MTTQKIKQFALPNLPYIMVFWFFSKCGEAYRLSTETEAVHRLIDAIGNLGDVISRPMPSFDLFDMLIGLIGGLAVFGMVWYKQKNAKNWRLDIEYGSARWGTEKDIKPYIDPKPEQNVILTQTESTCSKAMATIIRVRMGRGLNEAN